ncbi:MAG: hypothetical protein GMKNLPBB_00448 [Myxococcota bacterium]|nr:hypothetical protein [Myxococcota bacterium]
MKSVDTLILGGGLTGISCAYHLGPGHNWLLIDKEERLGGLCRTLEKDGFYFDVTGHYLHLRSEYAKQLVEKVFPDGFDMVARKSHVYSQGVFTHYPYQANTHGLPPETMPENLVGFFRAM